MFLIELYEIQRRIGIINFRFTFSSFASHQIWTLMRSYVIKRFYKLTYIIGFVALHYILSHHWCDINQSNNPDSNHKSKSETLIDIFSQHQIALKHLLAQPYTINHIQLFITNITLRAAQKESLYLTLCIRIKENISIRL